MADVNISKYRASVVRDGSKPSSPGFVVSEGQDPVNPPGTNNFVPYTGATGTVDLGAQTIEAGSFVKDGGTSSQFLKADGSVDSTAYGTGSVTSVGLTMPAAFSVANSPVTTAGTLAVTGAGNASQYIAGDGTLVSFPSLTGYVPYTGANQTVNLNTQQLLAGHTTITTNGSTDSLTVNHTSGSGKGINVTKGGNGEGLYVNKTSGSGNAATIVGTLEATTIKKTGGTSSQFLKADGSVDSTSYGTGTVTSVGLSSATSGVTIGSTPVTTSGTITLAIATASGSQNGLLSSTDWTTFNSKQNALTNPVTGTGTTNYLAKFTGGTTIGNSQVFDNGTNVGIGTASPGSILEIVKPINTSDIIPVTGVGDSTLFSSFLQGSTQKYGLITGVTYTTGILWIQSKYRDTTGTLPMSLQPLGGNLLLGTTSDNGARLQVSGSATIGGNLTISSGNNLNMVTGDIYFQSNGGYGILSANASRLLVIQNSAFGVNGKLTITADAGNEQFFISRASNTNAQLILGYHSDGYGRIQAVEQNVAFRPLVLNQSGGNVGIGNTNPLQKLHITQAADTAYPTLGTGKGALFIAGDTNLYGLYVGINTNDGNTYFQAMRNNSATAYNITMQAAGGNVLIGTTTDNGAKLNVNGTIRTANPTGSTSDGWLLGRALVSGTSTPDRWIRVQIGNLYYDILAVYMGSV